MGNQGKTSISVLARITDYFTMFLFKVINFKDVFISKKCYFFLIQEEDKAGNLSRSNTI